MAARANYLYGVHAKEVLGVGEPWASSTENALGMDFRSLVFRCRERATTQEPQAQFERASGSYLAVR